MQRNDRRTELVTLRASKGERKRLHELASARGEDVAELVREAVNMVARRHGVARVFRA